MPLVWRGEGKTSTSPVLGDMRRNFNGKRVSRPWRTGPESELALNIIHQEPGKWAEHPVPACGGISLTCPWCGHNEPGNQWDGDISDSSGTMLLWQLHCPYLSWLRTEQARWKECHLLGKWLEREKCGWEWRSRGLSR